MVSGKLTNGRELKPARKTTLVLMWSNENIKLKGCRAYMCLSSQNWDIKKYVSDLLVRILSTTFKKNKYYYKLLN